MIKINFRWIVQALALLTGIWTFSKVFDGSKALISSFSSSSAAALVFWLTLFCSSFFLLMFTSYLKQRANFTLRHEISIFENLIALLGIQNYKERAGKSDAKSRKELRDRRS